MKPTKKVYAVANGRQTGLYESYSECQAQVKNYPNALFKSFVTREEATHWLANMANVDKDLETPCYVVKTHYDDSRQANVCQVSKLPEKTLYQQWPLPSSGAANIVEYAVIVYLLQDLHDTGSSQPIYTTKPAMIYWIQQGFQNSSFLNSPACPDDIREFVQAADAWLSDHHRDQPQHRVGLWNEQEWGTIPLFRDHAGVAA